MTPVPISVDSVLGIDVAKAKADIGFERVQPSAKPIHRCYENSPAGHQHLLAWLATQAVGQLHVCLEATGSYSDALAFCLYQAGYRVSLVNPLRIKRYGESELRRITTDKSDAAFVSPSSQTPGRHCLPNARSCETWYAACRM